MDGHDFYRLAELIQHDPPGEVEEAADRTVAGRVYYAAFLYARDLLAGWGCALSPRSVHAQVSEGLKCSGLRDLIKIGHRLAELHDERRMADYEIDTPYVLDFEKLAALYEQVHRELALRWKHLTQDQRDEALDKMGRKIATYQR
jgi:hypothetical protein